MTQFAPIGGPAAWQGSRVDYREEGLHVLSASEIDEIDEALGHLKSLGQVDFPEIMPEMFPLPTFGPFLARLTETLRAGCGFLLLRGLPRERYSLDEMALNCSAM